MLCFSASVAVRVKHFDSLVPTARLNNIYLVGPDYTINKNYSFISLLEDPKTQA